MKQRIYQSIGWLSIVTGLISLVFLNLFLLSGYNVSMGGYFYLWILIPVVFGIFSSFHKRSRPLGLWGLGLGLYLLFFVVVMFMLGWIVAPFP